MRENRPSTSAHFCVCMIISLTITGCFKTESVSSKNTGVLLAIQQSQNNSSGNNSSGNNSSGNNSSGNNSSSSVGNYGGNGVSSTGGASSSAASAFQQFNGNNSSFSIIPFGCGIGGGTNTPGNFPIGALNPDRISMPRSLTIDATTGQVYVADSGRSRIAIFDTNGVFTSAFGTYGSNVNEFNTPGSTVVVGNNIFVQDVWNIKKCSPSGACTIFSSIATGSNYGKMAVDSSGNFLVTDGYASLTKLDAQGQMLSTLDLSGFGPMGIALDTTGKVYVGGNSGVKKCTPSWGTYTCVNFVNTSHPVAGLTVASGNLFIPQAGSIMKCTLSGSCTSANMGIPSMADIKTLPDGTIFVTSELGWEVLKFNQSGTLLTKFGNKSDANGQFNIPTSAAKDANGKFYVVDSNNHRVQKFNEDGTYLTQFGGYGSGNGQLNYPTGIALDCAGNSYIVDSANNRVQKFNASGNYISQFGSAGANSGKFSSPHSIAINANNELYISDPGNYRVQKCSSTGACSNFYSGGYAKGLAIDQVGNVYIGVSGTVLKCTHSGVCTTFASFSNTEVNGIAVDSTGVVYVVDNHYVQKCSSSGNCSTIVSWGPTIGQVIFPTSVMVDSIGGVFVTERGNQRLQKFNSTGQYQPH